MAIRTELGTLIDNSKVVSIKVKNTLHWDKTLNRYRQFYEVWIELDNKCVTAAGKFKNAIDAQNYKKYLEGLI